LIHHRPKISKDRLRTSFDPYIAREDIQGIESKLSEKQLKFVDEFFVDFNGAHAILRAGYETKYPNRMAHQLLSHPGVKFVINYRTAQRAKESPIKPDYVIMKVTRTIERAENEGNHTAVLKGCELLARHLGMFIERQEISGPNGDPIRYEQVKEAADAFTSAVLSLIERNGPEPITFEITGGDEG
jgi:hypothetical protein